MDQKTDREVMLEKFLENFQGSVLATDRYGRLVYANQYCLDRIHLTRENYLGKSISALVKEGFLSVSATEEVLKTKKRSIKYIKVNEGKESVMTVSTPIFDKKGDIELVCAFSLSENFAHEFFETIEIEKNNMKMLLDYIQSTGKSNVPLVAKSKEMQEVFAFAKRIAAVDSTVMLYGES